MLSTWASLTCNIRKFWPSVGALALPFLNFDFLRPARFSAVYFPAWFVTGEVEASVSYKGVQVRSISVCLFRINLILFHLLQFKESAWFDNTCVNHIMLRTTLFFLTWIFPLVISQVTSSLSLFIFRLF